MMSASSRDGEKVYTDIISMLEETNSLIKEVKVNKRYCYRLDSKIVGILQTMSSFKVDDEPIVTSTYHRLVDLLVDIQEFIKMSSVKNKTILGTFNKGKIRSTFDSLNQRLLDIMIEEPRLLPRDDTSIKATVTGDDDYSHNSRKKRSKAPLNLLSINSSRSHDAYEYDEAGSMTFTRSQGAISGGAQSQQAVVNIGGSSSSTTSSQLYSLQSHSPKVSNTTSSSSVEFSGDSIAMIHRLRKDSKDFSGPVWSVQKILQMMKLAEQQLEESLAIETFENLCQLFHHSTSSTSSYEEEEDAASVFTSVASTTRILGPTSTSEEDAFNKFKEYQQDLGNGGVCKLLVSTLSALEWSVQVCEAALRAVCYLTRFAPSRSSLNSSNVEALGKEGICLHIVTAMNTYARNQVLLFWACKAMSNLMTDCLDNNILLGEAGVCPVMLTLLKNSGCGGCGSAISDSKSDIDFAFVFSQQIWICLVSLSLSQENNQLLYDHGAFEVILSVWKNSTLFSHAGSSDRDVYVSRNIALWANMTIQNISLNDELKACFVHIKPSVYKLVVGSLTRYIEDVEVAIQAFIAVQNIANNNDRNNALLGDAGACEGVLRLIEHHITEETLVLRGCMALMNLSYNCERNRNVLANHGVCKVIKRILEIHLDREAIVEFAFGTIVNLTEDRNDLVLQEVSSAGLCESLMPAFLVHCVDSNCESVAELGGWAIKNLAMANHENNTILGSMGACEGITSALQGHMGHASVAEMCLWAIRALVSTSEDITNSFRLGNCGACEAVISALQLHYALEAVVEQGCGAVLNLAQNSQQNRALLMAADAYNVIIKAVKEHMSGTNEDIELIGFGALSNLMRTDDGTDADVLLSVVGNDDNKTLDSANIVGPLQDLLRAVNRKNESIAISTIEQVTNCAMDGKDGVHQTALGQGHVCEMLVHIVYPLLESKLVVCAALKCVCRLARFGESKQTANEFNISALGSCGMCKVVVQGLEHHYDTDNSETNDMELTLWGCKALTYLASSMLNNQRLGAAGGCDLVTKILYKYSKQKNGKIVEYGWGAVINMTLWEENNLRFGDAGICECLYDYMSAFSGNEDIVVVLLMAAQNIALMAMNRSRLGHSGVCTLIMRILKDNASNEAINEYSLMAVQKMALEVENCPMMLDMKVAELLVERVQAFKTNESIVELGILAIMNLSATQNDHMLQSLLAAGAVECISAALRDHIGHPEICEFVLIAAIKLASESSGYEHSSFLVIIDHLPIILKKHKRNEAIIEQACNAIFVLLRNKENVAPLQSSGVNAVLGKAAVSIGPQSNKLKSKLERTKRMVETGTLSSGGSRSFSGGMGHKKNSTSSRAKHSSGPIRPEPLRLERSSSSSMMSTGSFSSYSSNALSSHMTSYQPGKAPSHHHTATVEEVIVKLKKGIENVDEVSTSSCLRSIARMCEGSAASQAEFGAFDACKLVKDALSSFVKATSVAENSLRAVCYLSRFGQDKSTANDNNNRAFGEVKFPRMLVKTMRLHEDNEKVCLYGCKAIMNLGSFEANNDMLGDAGACEVVVSALMRFSHPVIVLKQGLWAMINLSLNKKNNGRFTATGCLAVVDILKEHKDDPDVAAWANMAIQNLCICKDNQIELGSLGAVELVVKTMELNIQDTMTIQFGLMAIDKLVLHGENNVRAGKCHACSLVLRCLQMYNENALITELCWKSTNRLSNQNLENSCQLVSHNVCSLLTSSLKNFFRTEEVVEQALAAVGYLGGVPSNQESGSSFIRTLLGNSGACEVVTMILTNYTSDEAIKKATLQQSDNIGIIFLCFQAIASLSINEDDNRSRFGACGACEKTIAAMTLHLGSEDIAVRGSTVILALAKLHPVNALKFISTGALTVILRIIQRNNNQVNVVIMGFTAMTTVLQANIHEKDDHQPERATITFSASTKDDGGAHDASGSSSGAGSRPSLRRDRRGGGVGMWEDSGSYELIIKTIRSHHANKEVCSSGLQLLQAMLGVCASSLYTTSSSGTVSAGRGVKLPEKSITNIGEIVVKVLDTYLSSSSRLIAYSCQIVTDLLADPRTNSKHASIIGKSGICESLAECLKFCQENPKHNSIIDKILLALASCCVVSENREYFCRCGLFEQVVNLVSSSMESESVVYGACHVLAVLAKDDSVIQIFSQYNVAKLAIEILQRYGKVGSIVSQCCVVLGVLSASPDACLELEGLTVQQSLVNVIDTHLHHASVTREGFRTMRLLCSQPNWCQKFLDCNAMSVLIKALRNHNAYYRPQTILFVCETVNLLLQADTSIASSLHTKGVEHIMISILENVDSLSPKVCRSSSSNRDLHENVPFSTASKRKQSISIIKAVLKLLNAQAVECEDVLSALFPGEMQVAPWLSDKDDSNEPNIFFDVLMGGIVRMYIDEVDIVTLALTFIKSVVMECPLSKMCFALEDMHRACDLEEFWVHVMAKVLNSYNDSKALYSMGICILHKFFHSVLEQKESIAYSSLQCMQVSDMVAGVASGLSTYLTDGPALLQIIQLTQCISTINNLTSAQDVFSEDLKTFKVAEKVIRVLQIHQHSDSEHIRKNSNLDCLTEAHSSAVKLHVYCCEALYSMCKEGDENNSYIGSILGYCELSAKMLSQTMTKLAIKEDSSLSLSSSMSERSVYWDLLLMLCKSIALLLSIQKNRYILTMSQCLQSISLLLLVQYRDVSISTSCCDAIMNLIPTKKDFVDRISIAPSLEQACSGLPLALNCHIDVEAIVRSACWGIAQLALDKDCRQELGCQGSCSLALRVLSHYRENLEVVELALNAIANLADSDRDNTSSLIDAGGMDQFEALLESSSQLHRVEDIATSRLICLVIVNMSESRGDLVSKLGQTTIGKSVLNMMHAMQAPRAKAGFIVNPKDKNVESLILQGCWVLKNLMIEHPANSAELGDANGCEIIVPLLIDRVKTSPQLAEIGCAVLSGLLTVDVAKARHKDPHPLSLSSNLPKLIEARGFDISIQSLFGHTGSESIAAVESACQLLYRFVFLTVLARDLQVESSLDSFGTIQHVMEEALVHHSRENEHIAGHCIRVLRYIYFRTFEGAFSQYALFCLPPPRLSSECPSSDRVCRQTPVFVVPAVVKLHEKHEEGIVEFYKELFLSEWFDLCKCLTRLLPTCQASLRDFHQLLGFIADTCNCPATREMREYYCSTGLISEVVNTLNGCLCLHQQCDNQEETVESQWNRTCPEVKHPHLLVTEVCAEILVALMEDNAAARRKFLELRGHVTVEQWLQVASALATGSSDVEVEMEVTLLVTSMSRVLLVLMKQEEDEDFSAARRSTLVTSGLPRILESLCLSDALCSSGYKRVFPPYSTTYHLVNPSKELNSSISGDGDTVKAVKYSAVEIEANTAFPHYFQRRTASSESSSRVECYAMQWDISAASTCVNALDVITLLIVDAMGGLDSSALSQYCPNGDFVLSIFSKLIAVNQESTNKSAREGEHSPYQWMDVRQERHLHEVCLASGYDFLCQHMRLQVKLRGDLSIGQSPHLQAIIKLVIQKITNETVLLPKHSATASVVVVTMMMQLLVQALYCLAMLANEEDECRQLEEMIPPVDESDDERSVRKDILFSIAPAEQIVQSIREAMKQTPRDSIDERVLKELEFYLNS